MELDRTTVVQEVLGTGAGKTYLEIGVQNGVSFRTVQAETKIGVDPALRPRRTRHAQFRWELALHARRWLGRRDGALLFPQESDDFFAAYGRRLADRRIDVALIDGLHTYEQAYRDVCNTLEHLADDGLIVMHDCRPMTATAALASESEAKRQPDFTGEWNGDVFKAVIRLRLEATDHRVLVLDTDHGLGLIYRGTPDAPPPVSLPEISTMTFDEYHANRETLIGLRSPDAFPEEILPALVG